MAANNDRLDELMARLDALLRQQEAFGDEIRKLQGEVVDLKQGQSTKQESSFEVPQTDAVPEEIPEKIEPAKIPQAWPDTLSLATIKLTIKEYEEGNTKGGTAFLKFFIEYGGQRYTGLCAANGNWIVQDLAENLIAKGRFQEDGKWIMVTHGARQGDRIQAANIIEALKQGAALHLLAPRTGTVQKESQSTVVAPKQVATTTEKGGLEKFIGENLIAVIAVVVLLIGVVFGVKYSIDHNLISPLTRVLMSYLLGAGILFVGMRLKEKYELFSATLVSGSMAILYITTYIAYSLYHLFPQMVAFGLMIIFTVFTVIAAVQYNRQVIAHIGLVGSYAIPFLLSDNSGKVGVLFTYMLIVNAGILVIAIQRHWKPLYYVAFGFTWLIYSMWVFQEYDQSRHFQLSLIFGTLFFVEFYLTFLVYKLLRKEQFAPEDAMMLILNSAVFYGVGYWILNEHPIGQHFLGLFTLGFACAHFIVSVLLYTYKLADRSLFHLTAGMVLTFLTLAIPVQLDGSWVTLLWAFEAAVLFSVGRTQEVRIYEYLSYPVQVLAFISLGHDWVQAYGYSYLAVPEFSLIANSSFLSSMFFLGALGIILWVNRIEKFKVAIMEKTPDLTRLMSAVFHGGFIIVLYNTLRVELDLYWDQQYVASKIQGYPLVDGFSFRNVYYDDSILRLKHLWSLFYTLFFMSGLVLVDQLRIKNTYSAVIIQMNALLVIIIFLTLGLYELSGLRDEHLIESNADHFPSNGALMHLRYVGFTLLALLIYVLSRYLKREGVSSTQKTFFELIAHTIIVWVLCSELIHLLTLMGSEAQHKLGLSILCGLYSFFMIGWGIMKRKKHLRIAAFVLFGLVFVKLFLYDIAHLTTIAKTVVFISLGLILLVISFLYNKFKDKIAGTDE